MPPYPLSPVDYVFTGRASQPITFAFFFRQKLDHTALTRSLSEVVKSFPLLLCQLRRTSETEFQYVESSGELPVEVRYSSATFNPDDDIRQYIDPVNTQEDEPLSKVVITHPRSGTVLALSISHAVVDGFSYFHFLSSWARTHRGERILQPNNSRKELLSLLQAERYSVTPEDLYSKCGLFYDIPRTPRILDTNLIERVFLSRDTIKSYIDEGREQYGTTFSENDVITAYLWKKYIPLWNTENANSPTYATCPFDFRRIIPGFPKTYFGCALAFATAELSWRELNDLSISGVAKIIKSKIASMNTDSITNSLRTLESFRQRHTLSSMEQIHLRHPTRGLIVTNLTKLPVTEIDFGLGNPGTFLAYAEIDRSAAILPSADGVEILVAHPEKK